MSHLILESAIAGYGGPPVLNGVDIAIDHNDIGVIVGPNGAGKSTALKAIFGLIHVSAGTVTFDGKDITNLPAHELVLMGLSFVPQTRNVFDSLTVHENLEMGAFTRTDDFSDSIASVYEIFPPLADRRRQKAVELSGGLRQMVAIGRGLMSNPRLILLDEPSAGLSPRYAAEILERVIEISGNGVAVLMVEQNARRALEIATKGFVLANGRNLFTGTGRELIDNPDVARSFLGGWNPS